MKMNHRISRRRALQGAGVCLTLPWLEGLTPNARAQASFPKRFLPIYFPHGAAEQWWDFGLPGSGGAFELPPVHSPFAAVKGKLSVLDPLGNHRFQPGGPTADAALSSRAFLTCSANGSPGGGISADQVLATRNGNAMPIPSLQFGLGTAAPCAEDACFASRSISWQDSDRPLVRWSDPQAIFDLVFGALPDRPGAELRRRLNTSILDHALDSAEALRSELSSTDHRQLDQFLTSVRDLERRVLNVSPEVCQPIPRPDPLVTPGVMNSVDSYDRNAHAEIINDLIVLAFQCDQTRVVSHMLDDGDSTFAYDHVTIQDFDGDGSGRPIGDRAGTLTDLAATGARSNERASVNHWYNAKVASLCSKLDGVVESDGTLLDHTVVFYASDRHGSTGGAARIPALLLGGTGIFNANQYVTFGTAEGEPQFRDLYLMILNAYFNLGLGEFGDDFEGRPHLPLFV